MKRTFEEILESYHVQLGDNRRDEIIAIAAEEYANQSKWISVEERLPDNQELCNDVVLFWSKKHGFPMIGVYDYEFQTWTRLPWEKGFESLKFEDVTHWQPLPTPPTK